MFLEVLPYRLPSGARITYPVFLVVSLAILVIFRRQLLRSAHRDSTWPVGIFAAYVVWMVVSTFWSYHPFTSISESLPVVAALLLAVCFSGWSLVATIKSLVVVGAVVALCSWVMFLYRPEQRGHPRRGLAPERATDALPKAGIAHGDVPHRFGLADPQ